MCVCVCVCVCVCGGVAWNELKNNTLKIIQLIISSFILINDQ